MPKALCELAVKQVSFHYGTQSILNQISLSVTPGEIVALLGANGAGKSTLLQLMLGLIKPSSGQVLLNNKPLSHYRRKEIARHIAYVPQHHECPFPYKVCDVIAMGLFSQRHFLGASPIDSQARIMKLLERFHLAHLSQKPYPQLSGGQQQIVLMCRALIQGASILVLDEPASALDFGHQARLLAHLRQLASTGLAVVMSTHHPQHATAIATRAVLMRQGHLIGQGKPAEVLTETKLSQLYELSQDELSLVCQRQIKKDYANAMA